MANYFFFIQSDGSAKVDLSEIKEVIQQEQLAESMKAMRAARNAQVKPILYERNGMICSRVPIPQLKELVHILEMYGAPISKEDDTNEKQQE